MKFWVIVLSLATACSYAQTPPAADAELCRSTSNPDLAIKACTAAIESRKADADVQAQWHVLRGVQWAAKGDYDRAIADHTAALKLDAKARHANYYRGAAYSNKGEFERAIADFDAAIQLKADDAVLYHARGIELSVKGDYPRAIADFNKTLQLNPKAQGVHFARGRTLFYTSDFSRAANDLEIAFDARPNVYTALWLFLARNRGGAPDAGDQLERDTRRLRAGWPAPVIALYLERTDATSVMAATASGEGTRRNEMRCEAYFYIAQNHLIKGERAAAQKLLQSIISDCPKNLLEHEGTLAELRRLK